MSSFSFFPEQAATFSSSVDAIYIFMLWVSGFFTLLVVALTVFLSIKYRKKDDRAPEAIHGNLLLELIWTGIPLLLTLVMFAWGTFVYVKQVHIPADAKEIFVVGKQWMWKIQHGEGPREMNELTVPVGKSIKLTMTSEDVIHSFYVPAFRFKADVVPGKYTFMGFKATKPGKYHLFCAEYCGTEHSKMGGWVHVLPQDEFDKWLASHVSDEKITTAPTAAVATASPSTIVESQSTPALAAAPIVAGVPFVAQGKKLFHDLKCISCHSAVSGAMGPNLNGLFGSEVTLDGGQKIKADANYIRESILSPNEKITGGYQALMPTYKGQVNEEQILAVVEYIKNLTDQKN